MHQAYHNRSISAITRLFRGMEQISRDSGGSITERRRSVYEMARFKNSILSPELLIRLMEIGAARSVAYWLGQLAKRIAPMPQCVLPSVTARGFIR